MIDEPFADRDRDLASALWTTAGDELRRAVRNRANRRFTGEIWDRCAREGVTHGLIERGLLEHFEAPVVPAEAVARFHRIAVGCSAAPAARREAFYSRLEALDADRVRAALGAAVDAQARVCMAGRASGWLDGGEVCEASRALAAYVLEGVGGASARLAGLVRGRLLELVDGATVARAA